MSNFYDKFLKKLLDLKIIELYGITCDEDDDIRILDQILTQNPALHIQIE